MNLKQAIFSLFLLLTVSSCNQFLDVKPLESISDAVTITDQNSALTALRGVYSALASSDYYGTSFQSIGYLSGDNVQWTGSQSQVQEFINHKVNADNATIAGVWIAIYRTINRANNVLAKVPTVTDPALTTALKNQYLGEAYAIRALAYFDLARTFGGVPLITSPTVKPTDNVGIKRSSQAETYAQVIKDLEAAEPLLPATIDRYRVTLLVPEGDIRLVTTGMRGEILLSALPERPFPFEIRSVTPVARANEGVNGFEVIGAMVTADTRIRPGMEGVAKIEAGERSLFWIWTHPFLHWLRVKAWELIP